MRPLFQNPPLPPASRARSAAGFTLVELLMVVAITVVAVQLAVDLAYALIDPRIRVEA